METYFITELALFCFGFPPKGMAFCNGQLLPINQNQAMFSLLGTVYGGDGRVNFALPNLQGRTPMHFGNGFTLGQNGGEQAHTLTLSELPQHTHTFGVSANAPDTGVPTNTTVLAQGIPGAAGGAVNMYTTDVNAATTTLNPASITNIGGSQAFNLTQPYNTLNFCIALQGVFPSQN